MSSSSAIRRWIRRDQIGDDEPHSSLVNQQRPQSEPSSEPESLDVVARNVVDALRQHLNGDVVETMIVSMVSKLTQYRLVDRICDLHRGRYMRWIRLDGVGGLHRGGTMVSVLFTDDGTVVICKLRNNSFIRFRFDQCIAFERLTQDELIIMAAMTSVRDDD